MKIIDTNPLISIIIPAYNPNKWIIKCLDSVLSQTYRNFECIIVDDGSEDGSEKIMDEYAAKDNRIKVIHKQNEGLSNTRNRGLKEAKGTWVAIIDSDDWMDTGYIEGYLMADAEAELVIQSIDDYSKDEPGCDITYHFTDKLWIGKEIGDLYNHDRMMRYGTTWSRLYRRSIIEKYNLQFNPYFSSREDVLFAHQYLLHCNKVATTSYYGYHYIYHPKSLVRTNKLSYRNNKDVSEEIYKACLANTNFITNTQCKKVIETILVGSLISTVRVMYTHHLPYKTRINYVNEIIGCIRSYGLNSYFNTNKKYIIYHLPTLFIDIINRLV